MTRSQSIVEKPVLTNRFVEALGYAAELHLHQRRKGKGQPYVGHLLGVAAIVIQHGGGEDEVIAALLHDAVEDQGGLTRLDEIREKFGDRVARIERQPQCGRQNMLAADDGRIAQVMFRPCSKPRR